MKTHDLIPIDQFCLHNNLDPVFIKTLTEYGLIEIVELEKTEFIPLDYLPDTERLCRLHYDLEINIEGIDAISHLLNKIKLLQEELSSVKERLALYE